MNTPVVQYTHHGTLVHVRADLLGKHREHCLCHRCDLFHPGSEFNCHRAQKLYEYCVENDMVTPVWECPIFSE